MQLIMSMVRIIAPEVDAEHLRAAVEGSGHVATFSAMGAKYATVIVHVFADNAMQELQAAATAGARTILSCAPSANALLLLQGHSEPNCVEEWVASCRADAYVWRHWKLATAIAHVLAPDTRQQGPLRLTFLGHCGSDHTRSDAPNIGTAYPIGADDFLVGRDISSDIRFSTSVARRHARLSRQDDGTVIVQDFNSTNGTFLNGHSIKQATMQPGDELAIAGFLRLRLDGVQGHPSKTQR